MPRRLARLVNLMLASILTGNEVGTWAAVHPALHTVSTAAQVEAEQALVRRYGALMPFLMFSTVLSCVPPLALSNERRSGGFHFTLAGMLCYGAIVGSTLRGNIPINQRTLEADPQAPPADWAGMRGRWDRLHTLRAGLTVTGLALLLLGALSDATEDRA